MAAKRTRSKKPSDTSYSSKKPPEPFTLFLDRNLGKHKVATLLREAGVRVEVHDDHFEPGAPDEVWLRVVGERGWFVVTKDQKIRYHAIERQALIGARVGAFILISKDLSGEEIGKILVGAVPAIGRFILKTGRPFLAKINREGKISAILED